MANEKAEDPKAPSETRAGHGAAKDHTNEPSSKASLELMLKTGYQQLASGAAAHGTDDDEAIKEAVNPVPTPHGVDKDGKPDGTLSARQVERAATEALHAMRPQPSGSQIREAIDLLLEKNPDGTPKQKYKDVDGVISAAKGKLKEVREPNQAGAGSTKVPSNPR